MEYNHQYLWQEIKKMYDNGELKGVNIADRSDFPSRVWIYKLFGNMKTIKDSIKKGYDYERAENRDNISTYTRYNYDYVRERLMKMAAEDRLTTENIKNDDTLPTMSNIWQRLGTLKHFKELKYEVEDICKNCMYELESCGKDKVECEQEYKEMWGD